MTTATVTQKEKQGVAIKTSTRESVLDQMFKAFDAISRRAYEIFDCNGHLDGHDLEDWFKAETELFHPVHLEINESDDSVVVKAEVPGFTENELEVSAEPCRLTISGKHESSKEEKKGKTMYSETCSRDVFRVVDLPTEIDTAKVGATLKDGVLQLTMSKAAKAVPVRPQTAA